MARTALDALLGRLLFDGVEAELLGGLNFESCTITIEDGYYTITPGVPTTRTISAGTNMTGGGDLTANRTLSLAATLTGITSINGATVAAPVQGTAITTTATVVVGGGNNYVVSSAGGAYTITLGTSGTAPYTGEIISLICANALANAITVLNGGAGGGNKGPSAGTMPAGVKMVCDFQFDGTNWQLAGVKRLA